MDGRFNLCSYAVSSQSLTTALIRHLSTSSLCGPTVSIVNIVALTHATYFSPVVNGGRSGEACVSNFMMQPWSIVHLTHSVHHSHVPLSPPPPRLLDGLVLVGIPLLLLFAKKQSQASLPTFSYVRNLGPHPPSKPTFIQYACLRSLQYIFYIRILSTPLHSTSLAGPLS